MTWSAIVLGWAATLTAAESAEPRATYPIPPRTLRQLVEEAEVIVTASVHATNDDPVGRWLDPKALPTIVSLEIDQVLKGDPGRKSIKQSNLGLICPAPARYHPGTRVLAFLDRVAAEPSGWAIDGFATHALSYGSKTLSDADLALYVERVKEQLAIHAMPEGPERRAVQLEWIVRCAEKPATRWEGAYELAPDGDPESIYDEPRSIAFAAALDAGQRRRLLDALLATERFGMGERCLEHLFGDDRDPRHLAWLVARLRATIAADEDDESRNATLLATRISRHDARSRIAELVEALRKADQWPSVEEERRRLDAERRRLVTELLALFPAR